MNEYIRAVAGNSFSAKDFRTWAATFLAARQLVGKGPAQSDTEAKRAVVAAVKSVAESLGNRPATCRKYYIHPVVLEAYLDGRLFEYAKPGDQPDEDCVRRLVERSAS